MTTARPSRPANQRARAALAGYLRLLAACLLDEADMLENDAARSDEVLARFREGVLALSLEDAPIDVLMDRMTPSAELTGTAEAKRATAKRRGTAPHRTQS
jgi:hypothetical protein